MKNNKACLRRQGFTPVLIIIIVLAVLAVGGIAYYAGKSSTNISVITNFEECVKAGNGVMESFPRKCRTANGELFVEVIENPVPQNTQENNYQPPTI
ncbi:MAG: hypothetical protein UU13_C0012G0012 [Candidatus Nomurabacteria bacterium GW2011_GWB1_40_7]|uniref:Uncharacterized protein n=1 Tax=Candidatus Nomurabacteria bacterium GW2011_GWB1_40_7 TaxID=1618744 RepID=A0A0G0T644_9BACT|nr:MAG: hypothetical protein UU13_C0012G0012 [Candidatus Nomurabacteria bacterium GW2011_GWB1_40_7]